MLEELMKLVQEHGQQAVVNNSAVPNEHNEGIMQEAGSSIMSMVQNMMGSGQGAQIAQAAADPNHPAAQQMQSGFMNSIMQKFGIDASTAQNVASSLLPKVLGAFSSQNAAGQQEEGGLGSMFKKLTGL
jgi:uncharacterized protein YidB (DUF937 family)